MHTRVCGCGLRVLITCLPHTVTPVSSPTPLLPIILRSCRSSNGPKIETIQSSLLSLGNVHESNSRCRKTYKISYNVLGRSQSIVLPCAERQDARSSTWLQISAASPPQRLGSRQLSPRPEHNAGDLDIAQPYLGISYSRLPLRNRLCKNTYSVDLTGTP